MIIIKKQIAKREHNEASLQGYIKYIFRRVISCINAGLSHEKQIRDSDIHSYGDLFSSPPSTSNILHSRSKDTSNQKERVKNLLQHSFVKVILVFDGRPTPSKANTCKGRSESKEENLMKGLAMERIYGKTKETMDFYRRAISISHSLTLKVVSSICIDYDIDYLVAPYEADAQLGYLSQQGKIDLVITEDSDTLPYGCRNIFFKMDERGNGDLIQFNADIAKSKTLNFQGWTMDQFISFVVLSGCDYLTNLPGIGIAKAYEIVKVCRTPSSIIRYLK